MTAVAGVASASPDDLPLLQLRPFRMLSYTRFTSRVATNAINFALVLLIVDETGKAFMSSLLVLALIVPSTLFGLMAGVAADTFPKRSIIVLSDLVRAAFCAWVFLQDNSVPLYFLVAVSLATVGQFAGSAEASILPAVVPRERLARANAIGHAITGAAQIAGFVILAPLALRVFGSPSVLFATCVVLYSLAAFQALFIGRVKRPSRLELGGDAEAPWYSAGWREIQRDQFVLRATIELTVISAAVIVMGGLIPTYIQHTLNLPVEVGVLVLLPAAAGIIIGLRIASFLAHRIPHVVLSTAGYVGFAALLLVMTFARPISEFLGGFGALSWMNSVDIGSFDSTGLTAMFAVMPLGFCYALVAVAAQTVLNDRVPLHLQGRVLATQGAFAAVASSLPVLVAGAATDIVGVTAVLAVLSVAVLAGSASNTRILRRNRRPVVGGFSPH